GGAGLRGRGGQALGRAPATRGGAGEGEAEERLDSEALCDGGILWVGALTGGRGRRALGGGAAPGAGRRGPRGEGAAARGAAPPRAGGPGGRGRPPSPGGAGRGPGGSGRGPRGGRATPRGAQGGGRAATAWLGAGPCRPAGPGRPAGRRVSRKPEDKSAELLA